MESVGNSFFFQRYGYRDFDIYVVYVVATKTVQGSQVTIIEIIDQCGLLVKGNCMKPNLKFKMFTIKHP